MRKPITKSAGDRRAMINDLALLRQAGALARHAAVRHSLIAENIANADTPGYQARDLPAFAEKAAKAAIRGEATETDRVAKPTVLKGLEASPNGNTVNLEDQMARSVDAQAQHAAALSIYRKSMEMLRLSVSFRG